MLTAEFIKYIFSINDLDPRIKRARDMNDNLLRHVEGVQELVDTFLTRINNYENEGQHDARIKHTITNKFVVSELLSPTNNVFSAKGGSVNFKFKSNQDKNEKKINEILKMLPNGYKFSQYIEQVWFNKMITDPNGLIFLEVTDKENNEENEIYPTYKNIHKIKAYNQNGIFVDWVIFEPHEIKVEDEKELKIFWAVDEVKYYKYVISKGKEDNDLILIEEKEHDFEKVPAVLCSDLTDNYPISDSIYKNDWKKSPIDDQIGLLDKYLISNSVLTLQEFMHVYAREWEYADTCQKCNGTGFIENLNTQDRSNTAVRECDCDNGRYVRKDPTDTLRLKPPEENQQKLDPPSGYTYLPTEPWKMQIDSVDRYFDMIIRTHWGATKERKDNETATGRWIDVQPVNNKLNKYSNTTEAISSAIVNFICKYYFNETFDQVFIEMGRRYLIETPDQIWEKYLNAKKEKAPIGTLDLLLNQFYESEFRENKQMFLFYSKKSKLEPFIHLTIGEVQGNQFISDEDKRKKSYFNEWIKLQNINDIIEKDYDELNTQLTDFINTKNFTNGQTNVS